MRLAAAIINLLSGILPYVAAYITGKNAEKKKNAEKTIDAVKRKTIRDNRILNDDTAYARLLKYLKRS